VSGPRGKGLPSRNILDPLANIQGAEVLLQTKIHVLIFAIKFGLSLALFDYTHILGFLRMADHYLEHIVRLLAIKASENVKLGFIEDN